MNLSTRPNSCALAINGIWYLELQHPGGDDVTELGMVSLYLWNMSNKAIDIDFGFSVNDGNGKQVAYARSNTPRNFASVGDDDRIRARGCHFVTRSALLSSLVNGTLIIEVHMKLATPMKSLPPPFIPENLFAKNKQRMIIDENFGDISFVVGGQQMKNNAEKVIKTAPVVFRISRSSIYITRVLHWCTHIYV